jgi:hypothetical protein
MKESDFAPMRGAHGMVEPREALKRGHDFLYFRLDCHPPKARLCHLPP